MTRPWGTLLCGAAAAAVMAMLPLDLQAEISRTAYGDLWARACKMGSTTHVISLPSAELALVQADFDNMKVLEAGWRGYYEAKKAFGAKMPAYPVWVEARCRCAASYIAARKKVLAKATSADLLSKTSDHCMTE